MRVFVVLALLAFAGCAANLCERKDRWFERQCAGTPVVYGGDQECERNLDVCPKEKLVLLEGYVACLERQNVCSLESVNQCGQQYPGARNLRCLSDSD